ncbi:hypothetical protein [Paenibacillus hunanensis]|uniref:hypothetical protein n=1 Tax=Paenibacillus hunanensis TaxID=539262 RepID=UPI00286AA289|nr:hypothetical protein [Paenibacillus hunanensis]
MFRQAVSIDKLEAHAKNQLLADAARSFQCDPLGGLLVNTVSVAERFVARVSLHLFSCYGGMERIEWPLDCC